MRLFRTPRHVVVLHDDTYHAIEGIGWDALLARDDIHALLSEQLESASSVAEPSEILSPAVSQEVWAAGVTYWRSREARMEESKAAGGGDFYDRVYSAE